MASDVNKDWTLKDKDQAHKDKDKDQTLKDKDEDLKLVLTRINTTVARMWTMIIDWVLLRTYEDRRIES
jgi:hypothetical protein